MKSTKSKASDKSVVSERVRLEAEIAAREVQTRKDAAIEEQRAKVKRMEEARDIEALHAQLEVYRKAESGGEEVSHGHRSSEESAPSSSEDYVSAQ